MRLPPCRRCSGFCRHCLSQFVGPDIILEAFEFVPHHQRKDVGDGVSANVHRRHLNESQRAAIAAQLATFTHGGDRSKAPIGALTDKAAAKLLNVGERSVERAKAVLNQATPNIQALIKSGEVAVSAATEVVKLPKEKQAELTTASKVREAVNTNPQIE